MTVSNRTGVDNGAPEAAAKPNASSNGLRRLTLAIRHRLTLEHLAVLVLTLLVLAVHDVGYIFSHPYWTDESWVVATTLFPLSQLPATTSSTPIGWSFLVRLFTVSGTESARLVPLVFAGIAVAVAYWFGRKLGWQRREVAIGAGVLAAIAMLLVPAMLVRDDLKQYTTDACFAILAIATASRLERNWSRMALIALSVTTWGGMLLSHTVAFVGAAAFAAVCVVQLARRDWRRFAEAVTVGVITAVLMGAVYEAFDAQAVLPGLTNSPHFRYYYLPLNDGLHAALSFISQHFAVVATQFGLGPAWLAVPLYVAGVVTVFRTGRPATALLLAVLWPEMLLISALRLYPFIDYRTSTFLFAVTAVVAAIGVAGVCALLRSYLKGALAAGLAALAVAGFAITAQPYARSHMIPSEDARDQVSYVAAHAGPDDVIAVNLNTTFNFAYYWRHDRPARRANTVLIQQYEPYYPGQPRIVMAQDRTLAGVSELVAQAVAQSRQHGCTPIWLVRTHIIATEAQAWPIALGKYHLTATPVRNAGLSIIHMNSFSCKGS